MADDETRVILKGDATALISAFNAGATRAKKFENEMSSSINTLKHGWSSFAGMLAIPLSVVGLSAIGKNALETMDRLDEMSQKVGVNTTTLQVLGHMAKLSGSDLDGVSKALGIMSKNMLTAEIKGEDANKALKSLDISARDLTTGALKSSDQILVEVADKFKNMEDSTTKTGLAMMLFGKSGKDMIPVLNQGGAGIKEMHDRMERLGILIDQDTIRAAGAFNDRLDEIGMMTKGLVQRIMGELTPSLDNLVTAFLESEKTGDGLKGTVEGITTVFKTLAWVAMGTAGAFDVVGTAMGEAAARGAKAWNESSLLGYVTGYAALNAAGHALFGGLLGDSAATEAAVERSAARIKAIFGASNMPAPSRPAKKDFTPTFEPKADKAEEPKSRLSDWKSELEQMKEAENAYFDFSLSREKTFWEEKNKLQGKTAEETISVNHELFEIRKREAKEATDAEISQIKLQQANDKTSWMQRLALEDQKLAAIKKLYGMDNSNYRSAVEEKQKLEQEAAKASIELNQKIIESQIKGAESVISIKEIEIRTLAELGYISTKKEIELNRQYLDEIYNLKLTALNREAELYKEQPVKYQEMLEKIKELEQKHNIDIAKSQQSLALDQKKRWDSFLSPIRSALDQSVQGIIQGTTTLKKAFQNLATSILTSMANMFVQLGLKWAEQQAMQLLGIGAKTAAEQAAAATTMATKSTEASVVIPLEAAKAGAGAAAAVAPTPFIGPALAIAAMAAVFAAVMGLMSAKQGWDVDKGGLTMIHDKEMVLPSHLAEGVRNMTAQRGGSGGNVTFNVNAFDSKDVGAFFKKHGSSIANSLKGPQRSFQLNTVLGRR
jgi:hypothetical protein